MNSRSTKFLILFLLIGATIGSTVLIQQKVHLESFAADETVSCDRSPTPTFGDRSQRASIQSDQTQSLKASLKQYQTATHDQRLAQRNQLKQLAQQRKDALILLMRQNPKEALSQISSLDPQGVISQVTKNCVPTESTVTGTLDITHADYLDGTSLTELAIISPTHERVVVNTVAGFSTQLESGIPVRSHGLRLDNDLLVNEPATTSVVQTTSTTPTPTPALATEAATTLVHKRVAIVMANFLDTNYFDTTMATVNDQVFNTINHYYQENSYGAVGLAGTEYGWYTLGITHTCDINSIIPAAIKAASGSINYTQIDYLMVVATYNCGWSGVAKIGYQSWSTPNGTVTIGTSIVDALAPTKTYGHETGHTFGIYHAAYLDCGTSVLSGSCTRDEYGDPFDIMGVYTYTENDILGQLNAYHKAKIGWLTGSSIPTVTTTNTYTLLPYESTATGIKALKIPSGSNTYYIEYRQPIGTDGNFRNTNIYSGALVHRYLQASGNGGGSDTDLLDMTPSGDAYYPVITPGNSYKDSSTGMIISVLSASSTGMSVKVTIPGTTQAPPTPTPTPIPGDLVVDSFQLLDSNGNVKTTFAPGEPIYPKLTPRNASLGVATAANKVTSEQFYSNAPTTVSQGTVSDVNVRLQNGQFQPGDTNTYYCVPAPGNKCSNYDQSQYWTKPAGSYTARVFLNYDHNALESNYNNNQATVSYTVVAPVTPTNTPTPTVIPTKTPTPSPTTLPTPLPTATIAPTATPAPGTSHINLSLLLQGIGNGGDNVNPTSVGNTNPLHPQRSVTLFIKDASNTVIAQPTGTVTYDTSSGGFKGTVDATITAGSYLITVQSPQFLNRTVSGIISLSPNTTTTLPVTTLVAGDVNNDNALNILDYNLILDCYSDLGPPRNCTDPAKKTATDITDDGLVNQVDYNLFLRNLGSQSGQ